MEKCGEYVCTDSKNVQEKPNCEWYEDGKSNPKICNKESSNKWGYDNIAGDEKTHTKEANSPKLQGKENFSERDFLSVINLSGGV